MRKRGTAAFMLPGGKPEPGEDDDACLARELGEELVVVPSALEPFGSFEAPAANEPGRWVRARLYRAALDRPPQAQAEISELLWHDPASDRDDLAALVRDHVLPELVRRTEMPTNDRPSCIVHWTEIERPARRYRGHDELMNNNAPLGRHFGLKRLGIHHERLLPGRRTSFPHAESAEEEFVYVIEGTPDVWLDGHLHRLRAGDAVGFPAGTGLAHTVINNTEADVRLLVVGETPKAENRIHYPRNPERRPLHDDWWDDVPERPLGDHDGLPDKVREWRAGQRPTQD